MRMVSWTDRVYYSVQVDAMVGRVSGFDDRSQEHWIIVEHGKGYRERRTAAVERIMASIEAGDPVGEVDAKPAVEADEDWR